MIWCDRSGAGAGRPRTVSQITLNYRGGPLSAGSAGQVHGGDRLPWVPISGNDNLLRPDTYVALAEASGAPDVLDRYCGDHGIRALSASR
jgi:hypothetical protein